MQDDASLSVSLGQLPSRHPFRTFFFDERYIWIGLETEALSRIFSFGKSTNISECSFWYFFERHCKLDGRIISLEALRGKRHSVFVEFFFGKELLPLFVVLYTRAMENGYAV